MPTNYIFILRGMWRWGPGCFSLSSPAPLPLLTPGKVDPLGSYLVNREVRDVGCGVRAARGLGDLHAARQGLPGLVRVHPPAPALGQRAGTGTKATTVRGAAGEVPPLP